MDWGIAIAIMSMNVALFGILSGLLFRGLNRLDGDIKSLSSKMDVQIQRNDRLYEMFIDLLKDRKV